MNTRPLPKSGLTCFVLSAALACGAHGAILNLTDYSLVPDGSNSSPLQTYDVNTNNGGTVVNGSSPVVYVVTTFSFGTGSLANMQVNFTASAGQDRLGVGFTDNGFGFTPGDGTGSNDFDINGGASNPASFMAGQTVTIVGKFEFDANYSTVYSRSNSSEDSFATFWVNPDGSELEGSGRPDGADGVANSNFEGDFASNLWNSSSFFLMEQRIFNNSTPGSGGTNSIINTTILTGADATFANAIALAIPEPSAATLGLLGSLLLLRRRRH